MQALQMFGYAEEELLGHDVAMLMPSPYREQHSNYIQRYLQSGQPKVLGASRIVEALHKEGYVMSLRFSLSEARSQVRVAFSTVHCRVTTGLTARSSLSILRRCESSAFLSRCLSDWT